MTVEFTTDAHGSRPACGALYAPFALVLGETLCSIADGLEGDRDAELAP